MTVITRFAPSPTGFLHIGGARTALFNWLYARHYGGKFLLRIEDTDRARSTSEAVQAIFDGLDWLELGHDGEAVFQSAGAERHAALAHQLLAAGKAYHCWCSPEELSEMREKARAEGRPMRYDRRWRDRDPAEAPPDIAPVIRFKAPTDGETVIEDLVQGPVRVANEQLDDMILLRSDGTPTYMLSVVVDDHDMQVSHAIRGDDHLTNAARQTQLFLALDWQPPQYAHIPLIHGSDGAKLSKRHGALAVGAYAQMGVLAQAMCNYLLRLGWSHGDDEIISREQAIEWFELASIGRSPARFDMDKLISLNGSYIRQAEDGGLISLLQPLLADLLEKAPDEAQLQRLEILLPGLKPRAKNLLEMAENALFLFLQRPLTLDEKSAKLITPESRVMMAELLTELEALEDWSETGLETLVRGFADSHSLKMGKVAQPLRASMTGKTISPGIFDVMISLGREESLGRLSDIAAQTP
ncbi:MAG: glutamate--tRNA ligase [Alphaproteobacteria bacterium]|jgi:glutamyl-tRNA synthetase|nr:glutamate--tRNA ligase [Alphaproteobacteria bacterium]MDP6591330.1 glutamate--tRNA ligase [Alphaproteobacteria bacterium]